MQIDELLIKKKPKKKKVLKESIIKEQPPITIGGTVFYPPFYSLNELVYDSKQQPLCKCVDGTVARWLMDFMWDNM